LAITRSLQLALGADVDHLRLARLLRRAHAVAIDTGVAPAMVRQVVSDSWRRSTEAGVDPARPAPRMLDVRRTAQRLAEHPLASVLPRVQELLQETMVESGYFAAFSDATGVLLWTEGPARALRSAVAPRFLPGCLCSEERIGTNAIGTALVLDRPVQIFSAEHFNHLLHGWICAAAPVHDPHSGELLGAIDISGEFRTAHTHSLALVASVARCAEGWLAAERQGADERLLSLYRERWGSQRCFTAVVTSSGRVLACDPPGWLGARVDAAPDQDRWPQPDGSTIHAQPLDCGFVVWRAGGVRPQPHRRRASVAVLGRNRAAVSIDRRRFELRLRHSEIIALLALHPQGMTVRDLALELYGTAERQATVRAEVARLRPLLGQALRNRPYRLDAGVQIDLAAVQRRLAEGDPSAAARHYRGPLLPSSVAPGVVAARDRLARALRPAAAPTPTRRKP
jgi:GAF domain